MKTLCLRQKLYLNYFKYYRNSVSDETRRLNKFEDSEFDGTVRIFFFKIEALFLSKFGPNIQNCWIKLKPVI